MVLYYLVFFACLTWVSHAFSAKSTSPMSTTTRKIEFELFPNISSIPAESWNSCLGPGSSPFLRHSWLQSLEESGCASPETGWVPQHLCLKINNITSGYVPLYAKAHSMGEFIFDNAWAEAAYANGINYYPKLLVGVPFTPVTGERILLHPSIRKELSRDELSKLRVLVGSYLKQLAEANRISSVHLNFLTDQEATDLSGELSIPTNDKVSEEEEEEIIRKNETTFLRRTSLQYHWTNSNVNNDGKPHESFEDYLQCFKSKRRINIRRERRIVKENEGVRVDAVKGKDILKYEGLVKRMYEIYVATVDKMFYGRQYLTLEFFQKLANSDFVKYLCFMTARKKSAGEELRAEDVFAGTFNIVKDDVFYGRYWGSLPGKEIKNLHFEVCYWSAIEYCIKNGLKRMEPGAGGGDYKWARGFDPALIHSAHYISHAGLRRAIRQFLDFETKNNVEVTEYLTRRSAVGSKGLNGDSAALKPTN